MDVHLRALAARQYDIVAAWQLIAAGATRRMIDHRVRSHGWRVVQRGVYALTSAPLTRPQRWIAAALTSPDSVLSHASAGACWGFRPFEASFETIARPGSRGRRRRESLLVMHSRTLDGETTVHQGIPITTAARTVIDLAAHLDRKQTGRMFREALRLRVTTLSALKRTAACHRGRRGAPLLGELATRYASIPYHRARSDAESRALEVLHDAGVELPLVNIEVAGEEADLVWPERQRIIEVDGPQYHRFRDEDLRKEARWRSAGYLVRRIASDVIYANPAKLIALALRPAPAPSSPCRSSRRRP